MHGTTLVTNAIIERKGSPTALLATAGHRDAIEIARERRYEIYDLDIDLPRPLVPRHLRFDVPERTLADGTIDEEVDLGLVERLARELADAGVEAIAISFLHSFTQPAERAARGGSDTRGRARVARLDLQSEVVPEIREYERTSTTVANVYVQRLIEQLSRRRSSCGSSGSGFAGRFYMMLSNGGIATPETAARFPVRAARVRTCGRRARRGRASRRPAAWPTSSRSTWAGTTAKLCVIERRRAVDRRGVRGRPGLSAEARLGTAGRIAGRRHDRDRGGRRLDRSRRLAGPLTVGPGLAGLRSRARLLRPRRHRADRHRRRPRARLPRLELFLGGRMQPRRRRRARGHRAARRRPARRSSVEDAACGIHDARQRGHGERGARARGRARQGPSSLPLFAFGGAGPVHACGVARALGVPWLVAPPGAGVLSASASSLARWRSTSCARVRARSRTSTGPRRQRASRRWRPRARRLLADSGVAEADVTHRAVRRPALRRAGARDPGAELPGELDDPRPRPPRSSAMYRALYEPHRAATCPSRPITWRVVTSTARIRSSTWRARS